MKSAKAFWQKNIEENFAKRRSKPRNENPTFLYLFFSIWCDNCKLSVLLSHSYNFPNAINTYKN